MSRMTRMKYLLYLIIVFTVSIPSFAHSAAEAEQHSKSVPEGGTYTVERVIDGNTLRCINDEEVQLIGIILTGANSDGNLVSWKK